MVWQGLSSNAKWALCLMLVATLPPVAGATVAIVQFGEPVPIFVYILPVIWVLLFVVSMFKLRIGLTSGIVWAVINICIPGIMLLRGVRCPIAEAWGLPVSPFAAVGVLISIAIIYFCIKAYRW